MPDPPMRELAAVCQEAVRLHGPDWTLIRAYIDRHLESLTPEQSRRLEAEIKAAAAMPEPDERLN